MRYVVFVSVLTASFFSRSFIPSAIAQSTAPPVASASKDKQPARPWLLKGVAAIKSVDKKYHAELHAAAAATFAQIGERAKARQHSLEALGALKHTAEFEHSFVRSEIARAWAWQGDDEKAMAIALLQGEPFDVTFDLLHIATAQHDRGDETAAAKTFDLAEKNISAMQGGDEDWERNTLLSNLANQYAWTGQFDLARKTRDRIKAPATLIEVNCWIALAETKQKKTDAARIKQIKKMMPQLENLLGQIDEPVDVPYAAANLLDLYARLGDLTSAERMLKKVTDPSTRSYALAAMASAHARVGQRDAFSATLKRAFEAVDAIRFDHEIENDVQYDKAWALASIASTMIFEGNGQDAKLVFDRAKPGLEKAAVAMSIAQTMVDETQAGD